MKEDFYRLSKERGSIEDFYKTKVDMTYNTVFSHSQFYKLIRNYPRLLVCLTYNELLGNAKRICKYFATHGRNFAARVEVDVSIVNGRKDFTVKRRNVHINVENYDGKTLSEKIGRQE